MTYHIRAHEKVNHLFDDCTCACNGEYHDENDSRYPFITVGKLDAKQITCKKCLSKLRKYVFEEIDKVMLQFTGGSNKSRSNRRSR